MDKEAEAALRNHGDQEDQKDKKLLQVLNNGC